VYVSPRRLTFCFELPRLRAGAVATSVIVYPFFALPLGSFFCCVVVSLDSSSSSGF
jgi:hypothetical protein